jgi:A nuclease family of the HNH/ENDO VII superfamily with conserved AHH
MSDVALVPVDHQPDFEGYSLVPVDHNPFSADGVTQQAPTQFAQIPVRSPQTQPQVQQAQFQPPPARTEPTQAQTQSAQPATEVGQPNVGAFANNTQASEPTPSTAPTPPPPAPTQVGYDGIPQAIPPSEPTSNVVTPQQVLQGAINQFYPGAQYSALAQQAYQNGEYGNAIGYGVGALADSLVALGGGKLLGAGIASLKGIAGAAWPLRRALERAGQVFQTGDATHHIVAKLARDADPARVILRRFGIDIHDAANGVFLRKVEHDRLHTKEYYQAVNKALAGAKSKAEAQQILQSIAQRLQSGTFP